MAEPGPIRSGTFHLAISGVKRCSQLVITLAHLPWKLGVHKLSCIPLDMRGSNLSRRSLSDQCYRSATSLNQLNHTCQAALPENGGSFTLPMAPQLARLVASRLPESLPEHVPSSARGRLCLAVSGRSAQCLRSSSAPSHGVL